MNTFQNKVVWITGASSGYGKALALAFAQAGAKVILSARREEQLQEIANTLEYACVLPLDLTQTAGFSEKTAAAIAAFGHIDVVIHNGAIAQSSPVLTTQEAVARQIMEVDYFSYTELTRCLLPHFIERQSGHIVVISGLLAKLTLPGRSSYAAAKAALFGYFGCLRAEMVNHNIDVSILVPGAMQTDLVTKALKGDGSALNCPAPNTGCPVAIAAEQSLQAIADKVYEAYIGEPDESFALWQLMQSDPNLGVKSLLDKIRSS